MEKRIKVQIPGSDRYLLARPVQGKAYVAITNAQWSRMVARLKADGVYPVILPDGVVITQDA